ncbi:hypothetical protein ECEC1849_0823, partial [Escherichia coli EC1849]
NWSQVRILHDPPM